MTGKVVKKCVTLQSVKVNHTFFHHNAVLRFLKNWTLPVAICVGTVFYLVFARVPALGGVAAAAGPVFDVLFPVLLFITLFITFTKVDFRRMRPARWHAELVAAQLLLVAVVAAGAHLTSQWSAASKTAWESVLTCVIAPCATAAPVVTAKLGGELGTMTAFSLISNVVCAFTIPLVFPLLEPAAGFSFAATSWLILQKVGLVLLLPLALGWFVRHHVRPLHRFVLRHPDLAFYTWGCTLAITTGVTVRNICHSQASPLLLLLIAAVSLAACFLQFAIGRAIGRRRGQRVNAGQGMFQKNTGMSIWVSYMYLSPVASIGAGCYVLWQNIINSYELWEKRTGRL